MMSGQTEEELQWQEAFQNRLKKRNFEQFSILLFDFHDSCQEQKSLLRKILFDDHTSVKYWADYIQFACEKFDKKNHLQRLVNKALEFLDEKVLKDDASFLSIHLNSAKLKSTSEEMLRYFQNTLWKREIGKLHAALYLAWADLEKATNGVENAVNILQKGIANHAEPRQQLEHKLLTFVNPISIPSITPIINPKHSVLSKKPTRSQTLTYFDNGEVQFNKKIDVPIDADSIDNQNEEKEEDVTQTQKIPMIVNSNNENSKMKTPSAVLRRLKVSSSNAFGKCQRIIALQEKIADHDLLVEEKASTPQTTISSINLQSADQKSQKKKIDLSKYVDDNIRNFNPAARVTKSSTGSGTPKVNSIADVVSSAKKQPFSVMETNIEVPHQPQLTSKLEVQHTQLRTADAIFHGGSNVGEPCDASSDTNRSQIAQQISASIPNVESNSDDSEGATVKMQTEELRSLFAAIPKEPIKLTPLGQSGNKRKRVSFTQQDDIHNIDQRKMKEPKKEENQVISSSSSSSSSSPSILPANSRTVAISSFTPFGIFSDPLKYITVCNKKYVQTSLMGKGGSSAVKRVISCDDGVIYALKVVEIKDNEESDEVFDSYANEIRLLQKLKGTSPYIIDLVESEISRNNLTVTMLLEAGDIDLAKLLSQKQKQIGSTGANGLDPIFARMVWKEMLLAVHHIHEHRIVHGDLKPANFVFVKGHLKLIDFGIAKSFSTDTTNIYRDSQIGTVNYMAPEAIAPMPESICHNSETNNYSMKLGRASDIWSLGCILYQIIFTRPPFAALNTIQKLAAIPNPKFEIQYPPCEDIDAVQSIKACLIRNPKERSPIVGERGLLGMKYLTIPSSKSCNGESMSSKVGGSTIFDESAAIEKFAPVMIDMLKMKLIDKMSGDVDQSLIEGIFKGIDVKEVIRSTMNCPARDIATSTVKVMTPMTTKVNDTTTRTKTPCTSLSLSAANKENPTTTKAPSIQSINKKPFIDRGKSPIKILPLSLKEQIQNESNKLRSVKSAEGIANASKWQRPISEPEPSDLRSALEKRIDQMRKFLSDDQENHTATESIDLSFSYNFM